MGKGHLLSLVVKPTEKNLLPLHLIMTLVVAHKLGYPTLPQINELQYSALNLLGLIHVTELCAWSPMAAHGVPAVPYYFSGKKSPKYGTQWNMPLLVISMPLYEIRGIWGYSRP